MKRRWLLLFLLPLLASVGLAQRWGGWRGWGRWRGGGGGDTGIVRTEGGVPVDMSTVRTAREIASHSTGTPNWTNAPGFEKDVFTFVRVIYRRAPNGSGISVTSSLIGWITDFPDSDLNLSYRLQQVTSIKVDPDGRVLRLTDPALFDYPWIYMVEPGGLSLRPKEVVALRKYLLNGGVLWADDFWGEKQWDNFAEQMHRVLPNRKFVDLPMSHPIFHCVFDLKGPMNKLQTPNMAQAIRSLNPNSRDYGITWEYYHDDYTRDGAKNMHVRVMLDDHGQIMIIATHNCDNGDSWEREGENDAFFHAFSEKRGFPLAINIIYYLMTH